MAPWVGIWGAWGEENHAGSRAVPYSNPSICPLTYSRLVELFSAVIAQDPAAHCRTEDRRIERKAHMTDHYPVPGEGSWEARGAGADRPDQAERTVLLGPSEAWPSAPLPSPGPPPPAPGQDRVALSVAATPVSADAPYMPVTQNQSPP